MGVNELLEVFLELEQLNDKLLRLAVVHERKKLQALANGGTTHTKILDVITIDEEDDDARTTPTNNQQEVVDKTHNHFSFPEDKLLQKRNWYL